MSINSNLRDGEATLVEKIFEDDSFNVVVQRALDKELTFGKLRIDRVTKDGLWKSTEESTTPSAVLYFKSGNGHDHLIVQRSEDEKYGLFKYKWTP